MDDLTIALRLVELQRRITDLERLEFANVSSGSAAPANAPFVTMALDAGLTSERVLTAGQLLDLTDGGAGGLATLDVTLQRIIRISATTTTEYANSAAGMAAAVAAAASGDVIVLPPCSISGNYSIPDGVLVRGQGRANSILTGTITLGDGAQLLLASNLPTNASGASIGVIGPGNGTAYIRQCTILASGFGGTFTFDAGYETWLEYLFALGSTVWSGAVGHTALGSILAHEGGANFIPRAAGIQKTGLAIPVVAGMTISAWFYSNNVLDAATQGYTVYVLFADASNVSNSTGMVLTTWTQVSLDLTASAGKTISEIRIYAYSTGGFGTSADTYIDDVVLFAGTTYGVQGGAGALEIWDSYIGAAGALNAYGILCGAGAIRVDGGQVTGVTGSISGTTATTNGVQLDSGLDGSPLLGDRSAFDVASYATYHASDISAAALLRHLPAPGTAGNFARDNGTNWVSVPLASYAPFAPTARGDLISANATPAWARLALGGIAGSILTRDATDPIWSAWALSGTAAQTYTFPAATDTLAGLATANVFTANQQINASLGIGIAPAFNLHLSPLTGSGSTDLLADCFSNSAATNCTFSMRRARGTLSIPALLQTDDAIGNFVWWVWRAAGSYRAVTQITSFAEDNHTSASLPTYLTFKTTASGAITAAERMRLTSAGNLLLGTTTALTGGGRLQIVGAADAIQALIKGHTTQTNSIAQVLDNAAAAGIRAMFTLTALGSGAANDGGSIVLQGKTSTTAAQNMGRDQWLFVVATHASYTTRRIFSCYDAGGEREIMRGEASGTAPMIGFLGAAAVVRQSGDIAAGLVNLGLFSDASTLAAVSFNDEAIFLNDDLIIL